MRWKSTRGPSGRDGEKPSSAQDRVIFHGKSPEKRAGALGLNTWKRLP
jgi:hypothetical protein